MQSEMPLRIHGLENNEPLLIFIKEAIYARYFSGWLGRWLMSTPRTDLIAIIAELDQQIAQARNAIADPSIAPTDRGRALLNLSTLKSTQANAERLLRLCSG